MATVNSPRGSNLLAWWERPAEHPKFVQHFDARQRKQMIDEDLFAGRSVSTLLASVVALGMLAMTVTVIVTLLT